MYKKLGYFILTAVSFLYLANKPEIDRFSLRTKVTDSLVMLTYPGKGGGTGFAVRSASGADFILTNDHICEIADDKGVLYAFDQEQFIPLKVMHRSVYTDLCLVSPLKTKTPLKLASYYYWGEKAYIVGHPLLFDDTMTEGELVQKKIIDVIIKEAQSKEECETLPKYKFGSVNLGFFSVDVCMLRAEAVATTVQILPGNSGSPVVDSSGKLIGVAFAASAANLSRAWIIPLEQIEKFLSTY